MTTNIDNSQALEAISNHRLRKERVVFTNGCFDILHPGHVRYLSEAKQLGDILVIGLNSDDSIRRLKGPTRPINDEEFRREMLLALKSVDYVVIFDDDTPAKIIEQVCPDVLVKGGDWSIENIVGHEFMERTGGKTYSLKFANGYSSTQVIEKIKQQG